MFDKIFISYASDDYDTANAIYKILEDIGYDPWIDKEKINAGQDWLIEIEKALKESDFIILVLSKTSVSKRGFVQREFKMALDYCKNMLSSDSYVLPLKIDDCAIPFELSHLHVITVGNNYEHLLKAIAYQRDKYLAEKGLLGCKILIERKDEYMNSGNFYISYCLTGCETINSGKNNLELTVKPGIVYFSCSYRLWEGAFGSRYKGWLWFGKSEQFRINIKPGSTHKIVIEKIFPYKSLRGGVNGLIRTARRALGAQFPDSSNKDTYPVNVRVSILSDN